MPKNVRNFWLSARIDGRNSLLEGGPQSKDGGFSLAIFQRDGGDVREAAIIEGREIDGVLTLRINRTVVNATGLILVTER